MIYHQFVTDCQHFSTHISNMVHTLELFFINKCPNGSPFLLITLFWLQIQYHFWTHFSPMWSVTTF